MFIRNFVCVLTNERYKTYQTGFLFCRLGHAPGVGLWGTRGAQGVKKKFQTWSCGISNRQGWQAEQNARNIFILGSNWWPWGELKRSNIIYMSISKILIPNSLCVFSYLKDRKHMGPCIHRIGPNHRIEPDRARNWPIPLLNWLFFLYKNDGHKRLCI